MIEKQDLRIGNYVLDRGGKILRVDWIEKHKVCMDLYNDPPFPLHPLTEDFEYLQPIVLTPEILLDKCGFSKKDKGTSIDYHIGINPITHDWLFYITWINGFSNPFYMNGLNEIKYLHSIQNIYWDLNKKELEINI